MTAVYAARINDEMLARHIVGLCAQQIQNFDQGVHVVDVGQVFDRAGLVAQERCRDHGHGGVLAAADGDLAHEGTSACDQHFILAHKSGPKAG